MNKCSGAWWRSAIAGIVIGSGLPLLACKYSVRDVGFVALTDEDYRFHLFFSKGTNPVLIGDSKTIATATFIEGNVRYQAVPFESAESQNPARLMAEGGIERLPAALLESPEGAGLRIPLSEEIAEEDLWDLMEAMVSSPAREKLLTSLLDAFAVIVLLESEDRDQNEAARRAIDQSIQAIAEVMPRMPKPVDTPPLALVVGSGERQQERVFLWSLGFDLELTEEPQAAILIGRGRRLGSPMQGGLITKTRLQQMLAIIGQDCECDLDRSWMQGPVVPLRWDSDQQRRAYDHLAFDPENPLVKAEIARILARGPQGKGARPSALGGTMDGLLLGYREEVVALNPGGNSAESAVKSPGMEPNRSPGAAQESGTSEGEPAASPSDDVAGRSTETPATSSSATPIPIAGVTLVGICLVALVGGVLMIARGPGS